MPVTAQSATTARQRPKVKSQAEGRRGKGRGVTLLADDDHGQVVPVGDGQPRVAARIEAPFQHIALDGDGTGDLSELLALGHGSDVDEDGSGALCLVSRRGLDSVQPGTGSGQDLLDAPGADG